jgi:hypothetical protein
MRLLLLLVTGCSSIPRVKHETLNPKLPPTIDPDSSLCFVVLLLLLLLAIMFQQNRD